MPTQKYLSVIQIKIDGTNVSQDFSNDLLEVVVDTSLGMPGMFYIRLHDPDMTWIDDTSLDFGKTVQIDIVVASTESGVSSAVNLISGEITALEPNMASDGHVTMTIRGYDKTHRLYFGRTTKTYLNIKDSDLASQVASAAGLTVEADATSITYPQVFQYNQTGMEFLKARAERIGYQVYGLDGKLYFKKSDNFPSSMGDLVFLDNLMSFEPRWTLSHQASETDVKGWDPVQKTAISSTTSSPGSAVNQGGMEKTAGSYLSSAIAAEKYVIVDRPVTSQADAQGIGDGIGNTISREFVQAEGVCVGAPELKAGVTVNIDNVGTRFSGMYFITSATHIYNANVGYETRFTVSGHKPNTLSQLLSTDGDNHQMRGLTNGVVIGIVTNVNDEEGGMGRVKVKFPWLDDTLESNWMRIAGPMAGSSRGIMFLPEVDDEVLVAFEHGDFNSPYVIGMLWNGTDKPPLAAADAVESGQVIQRIIKTRVGHTVQFSDKAGEEQILIQSKSGHQIILADKSGEEKMTIKDKTGNNSLVIDSAKNSMTVSITDFTLTAKGKVTIDASQDVAVSSKTNLSLSGQTKGELKGGQISVNGTGTTEVKGASVSVNGSAQTEVKGGTMVQIQGALVKIN
jgi:phage protein D